MVVTTVYNRRPHQRYIGAVFIVVLSDINIYIFVGSRLHQRHIDARSTFTTAVYRDRHSRHLSIFIRAAATQPAAARRACHFHRALLQTGRRTLTQTLIRRNSATLRSVKNSNRYVPCLRRNRRPMSITTSWFSSNSTNNNSNHSLRRPPVCHP